jgi:hypothetical protein
MESFIFLQISRVHCNNLLFRLANATATGKRVIRRALRRTGCAVCRPNGPLPKRSNLEQVLRTALVDVTDFAT